MDTGNTDLTYYGLSHLRDQHREGDVTDMSDTNKVNQFAADMWEVFDDAGNLLLKKHKDYGPTNISRSQVDLLTVYVCVCGIRQHALII